MQLALQLCWEPIGCGAWMRSRGNAILYAAGVGSRCTSHANTVCVNVCLFFGIKREELFDYVRNPQQMASGVRDAEAGYAFELFPEASFVKENNGTSKGGVSRALVRSFNAAARLGHHVGLVIILVCLLPMSPLIGIFSVGWAALAALFRRFAFVIGRNCAVQLGISELLRAAALYLSWQRRQHAQQLAQQRAPQQQPGPLALALPAAGYVASQHTPLLPFEDAGLTSDWSSGWRAPVRWFNGGYSAGVTAGTLLITATLYLAAPLIGCFMAGVDVYGAVFRGLGRGQGRLVTDLLAVTEVVDQGTALMLERVGSGSGREGGSGRGEGEGGAAAAAFSPFPLTAAASTHAATSTGSDNSAGGAGRGSFAFPNRQIGPGLAHYPDARVPGFVEQEAGVTQGGMWGPGGGGGGAGMSMPLLASATAVVMPPVPVGMAPRAGASAPPAAAMGMGMMGMVDADPTVAPHRTAMAGSMAGKYPEV